MKKLYTNGEIDRAGKRLAQYNIKDPSIEQDIKIISEWRDAHLFGTNKLSKIVNKRSKQIGGNNTIVSRLKKLESIKLKLQLKPQSNLCRMQDIGGCRVIVENIKRLNAIISAMSSFHGGFRLIKVTNYLDRPRDTGYRGVHLIFELNDKDPNNYKILLELQCRTLTQHLWATTVETVGLFNGVSLKSNQGDDYWKEFFLLISMLFEYDETGHISCQKYNINDLISKIISHNRKYNCLQKILNYRIAKDIITKDSEKKDYYLLILDLAEHKIGVRAYSKTQSENAQQAYKNFEALNNPKINVVLVSAESVEEVNAGYPNYFADTEKFIQKYNELIKKYK